MDFQLLVVLFQGIPNKIKECIKAILEIDSQRSGRLDHPQKYETHRLLYTKKIPRQYFLYYLIHPPMVNTTRNAR